MRGRLLALLLLCLVGQAPGVAEPLDIRFSTLPPDCTVVDLQSQQTPGTVGSVTVQRPGPGQTLRFRLFKAGYNSLEVSIPASQLGAGSSLVWPSQRGSFLRLEPMLVTATFFTAPSGVEIWTARSGQSDDYLGVSGQPLLLNLAELLNPSREGFFRVRLVAPGYQSVEVPIPQHLFGQGRPNRWPAQGEYAMAPSEGLLAPLIFAFRLKPWASSLLLVATLSLLVLLSRGAAGVWRSVQRARAIEQRKAEPGGDLAGSRLGPYRLYERLGKGATATVFRAALDEEDPGASQLAVKVFHWRPDAAERLAREVRPLLELRHPNLLGLLDWGQADGFAYLVTELVPGRTLREELAHGSLRLEPWRVLVDDLLRGLAHAHEQGVVHGDIKPENILLPWHGKAKLVDFGLARYTMAAGLERFGGTPGYMAPELTASRGSTPLSDQFAAGTVLFEAIYGVFPGTLDGRVPARYPELLPLLQKMRHPWPEQRFDDVEEARQALLAVRLPVQAADP